MEPEEPVQGNLEENNNGGGEPEVQAHQPVVWSGELPGPDGLIATFLHSITVADQRKHAEDFYGFLTHDERQFIQLNMDEVPRFALVSIASSSQVKVVFGCGIGASGIGTISPLDNKLLFLTGDGGHDIGVPTPLVLPPSMGDKNSVHVMTEAEFGTSITAKGKDYS